MLSLKTWTAHHGGKVIIITAECVEVARQLVEDRHGIELANADLVPAVTRSRWSRVIESDKAAIVAELERLYGEWLVRAESRAAQVALSNAIGVCDGLDLAMQVVNAGGALPPEDLSDSVNQVSE